MTELTTVLSSVEAEIENAIPDQSGASKPLWHDLESLAVRQWDEPAEVEMTGPTAEDEAWWAESSPKDEPTDEPNDLPTDDRNLDHLDEMADALAQEAEYHRTLESLGYHRPARPLTDADLAHNGGTIG